MDSVEVVIARVSRAHGIRGELSLDVRTDEPDDRLAPGSRFRFEGEKKWWEITSARWNGDKLLVALAGLSDRNAAELLRGKLLMVDVDPNEVPADPEEYYDRHLIGLTVFAADGREVGEVVGVHHHELQDALIVESDGAERLIPFTTEVVPVVDLQQGRCTLADLPGLLDMD